MLARVCRRPQHRVSRQCSDRWVRVQTLVYAVESHGSATRCALATQQHWDVYGTAVRRSRGLRNPRLVRPSALVNLAGLHWRRGGTCTDARRPNRCDLDSKRGPGVKGKEFLDASHRAASIRTQLSPLTCRA
jgi:hypothetical protein